SDRSYRRYRLLRAFMSTVLADVRVFAMQSAEDARRIIALGVSPERVFVTGNVKNEPLPDTAGSADLWRRLLGFEPGRPVWIAGSTHEGEEEAVLGARRAALRDGPELGLVIAPRHPERAAEVLGRGGARGWPAVRRSELGRVREPRAVSVLDTVGELATLYAVADVVFVGGSLVPFGGHNMLEPALRRKPVLMGPHTQNFRESAALLESVGAAWIVRDGGELGRELTRLLADAGLRAKTGEAGYGAVASRHGPVRETLERGGPGKTPAVEVAVQTLAALGHRPAVVSRGYGRGTGGIRVVADAASIRLDAEEAGDEPFLLARRLPGVPVVVGSNRYDSARLAL